MKNTTIKSKEYKTTFIGDSNEDYTYKIETEKAVYFLKEWDKDLKEYMVCDSISNSPKINRGMSISCKGFKFFRLKNNELVGCK